MMFIKIALGFILFNYISWAVGEYIDNRYKISEFEIEENVDLLLILTLGFIVLLVVLCKGIGKIKINPFKVNNTFGKLGKLHRDRATDVTYQLEKHLLDKE